MIRQVLNLLSSLLLKRAGLISAQIHSRKSEKYIFEDTLSKLNVTPEECVFIDNTEKNLIIPKQMGMSTLLFDDEKRDFLSFKKTLEEQYIVSLEKTNSK